MDVAGYSDEYAGSLNIRDGAGYAQIRNQSPHRLYLIMTQNLFIGERSGYI